ncbi:MAG: sigma-70 family RNA polymerase sigma factor [Planctomycetes bacterium]|nr:sigma-70 family RNA polymerase sigma factor [Planctomycetota bacterium]
MTLGGAVESGDVKNGELEDLFERYRSRQDLSALGKLFDLAAPELLRLAVHMAPDVASAEDLVQQCFLAALERPQRWRASEPLLPWLFGILTKLARKQRRDARRSPEPDRLWPRRAEDPASDALSAEVRAAVVKALAHLPTLYREVVRASLLDGKPPGEIARELERAPGTVRMQLLRGLELLRRALPAGLAGGGALLLCGTRGEAALRAAVLERAATPAALGAVALSSPVALGGLYVSTKTLVAVLACAAVLCTWTLWPRDAAPPRTEDVTVVTSAPAEPAPRPRRRRAAPRPRRATTRRRARRSRAPCRTRRPRPGRPRSSSSVACSTSTRPTRRRSSSRRASRAAGA